jgi:hypothetical protein
VNFLTRIEQGGKKGKTLHVIHVKVTEEDIDPVVARHSTDGPDSAASIQDQRPTRTVDDFDS